MRNIDELKEDLMRKRNRSPYKKSDLLSTGSTLINLACSGRIEGGFCKGMYFFLVGDTSSGKTFLSLTCLAEASINSAFDSYRFIYDGGEHGALMDLEKFFGKAVAERLVPPNEVGGEPRMSHTVEEFYYHFDDAIKEGKPFIYILDSMDCLSSEPEANKFDEHKVAYRKGKDSPGSYGDGKAKYNSANLRRLLGPLKESGSILIVINQTRDNIGFGFEKKTRSGGHALGFYAQVELWSSIRRQLTKTVGGKKRQLGIRCKVDVKRSRFTGRKRSVEVPIYHSTGIDDVGSCVDYLVDEGYWKTKVNVIEVTGIGPVWNAAREQVIGQIEGDELEEDLRELVGMVWGDVEKACEMKRKRRY